MSASNKKKLRKAQETEMLTARQRQEQAEAKKLKIYTVSFLAAMIAIVIAVVGILTYQGITNSGIIEKKTIAANVNGQKINSVEMTYYYQDAIGQMYEDAYNSFSSYYELYFEAMGLDLYKPLNEQTNSTTGDTWANYFVDTALQQAKFDYTFSALAEEHGYTLSESERADVDTQIYNLEVNSKYYGYTNPDNYLKAVYGAGSTVDSYKAYLTRSALATAYCQHYYNELTVDQPEMDEYFKDKENDFNAYDYSYIYLSYTDFIESDSEEETTTYTDEQKAAGREAAKKLAEELYALGNLDDIRDRVNEIENTSVVVKGATATLHTAVNTTTMANWLASEDRQPGEVGLLENSSTDSETGETTINGYYVICFLKKDDNTRKMSNVRHLLVAFEGGEEDEYSGEMNYSAAEKEAAKTAAEELLQQWRDGEATKESFIALVKEHTDDTGSAETGGLYENIHSGSNYVPNFLDWAINPDRKEGDVEIVETEYGYHIMYFDGYSEQSRRDQLITDAVKSEKYENWYNETLDAATASVENLSKIPLSEPIAG